MPRIELDRMDVSETGALGPGKRMLLWFHGCPRHCKGCIAQDWNDREKPVVNLSVGLLTDVILQTPGLEGITISGGEPFMQAEALLALLQTLKDSSDLGVIIYTGYRRDELISVIAKEILSLTDALIDGTYEQALDDGKPYRGSSNQVIHVLTHRYDSFFADTNGRRNSEMKFHDGLYTLTGIPDNASLELWQRLKHSQQTAEHGSDRERGCECLGQ